MTNVVPLAGGVEARDPLTNLEAEAALLGALLHSNSLISEIADGLAPDDFAEPLHARLFAALLRHHQAGRAVTPLTLRPEFERDDGLQQLGGLAYLARLTGDLQGLLAPREIANQIAELAERRRLDEQLAEVRIALREGTPLEEIALPAPDENRSSNRLPLIDTSAWSQPAPQRRSAWGDWLPLLKTTLLTGEGGVGKSLFAQMLLTCIATGRHFLGMNTLQGNALYLTAEDDGDELWRRQKAICQVLGIDIADIAGKLHLCSLDGEAETALVRFDSERRMTPTRRWQQIREVAQLHDIRFFGLDNATDLIAGDHNDAHEVGSSVNLLTGLAIERDGATLLLHHPNKAGEDWLGSVAWHNKVRSRLIIKRLGAADPDGRTIENPKANYGPAGGKIEFRWHQGAFIREDDLSDDKRAELSEVILANGENGAFLACLRERAKQGDHRGVGCRPGPNYAPAQFEGMAQARGYDRHALKRAMDRLFATGKLEVATISNKTKGREISIIRELPDQSPNASPNAPPSASPNASPNASRTLFPNAPERAPNPPRTHSPLLKEGDGAPIGAAAPSNTLEAEPSTASPANEVTDV